MGILGGLKKLKKVVTNAVHKLDDLTDNPLDAGKKLINKGASLLNEFGGFMSKTAVKTILKNMRNRDWMMNNIGRLILDNPVVNGVLEYVIPYGDYVKIVRDLILDLYGKNYLSEAADILELLANGEIRTMNEFRIMFKEFIPELVKTGKRYSIDDLRRKLDAI